MNEITLSVFETYNRSDELYSSRLSFFFFFFCGVFSVCGRWWVTQGACGHPRCETTLLSAAPLIAHSRSGTQRQENVSTPSMGIPQQCAACTYMRKGMWNSVRLIKSCVTVKRSVMIKMWLYLKLSGKWFLNRWCFWQFFKLGMDLNWKSL